MAAYKNTYFCGYKEEKISRSELFRRSVVAYWQLRKEQEAARLRAERIKEAMHIQEELRQKTGSWDGIAEIRKWRESTASKSQTRLLSIKLLTAI